MATSAEATTASRKGVRTNAKRKKVSEGILHPNWRGTACLCACHFWSPECDLKTCADPNEE